MLTLLKKEYADDEVFTKANALYTRYLTSTAKPAPAAKTSKPTTPTAASGKSESAGKTQASTSSSTSSSTTTAGTVAGVLTATAAAVVGTVGAAVGAVAQKVVEKPAETTYRLDVSDSEDDDFNLSDDDEDDGGAAAMIKRRNDEALAKVLEREKSKPKARSSIIWDVKPEDDTTDMDVIEKTVRAIQLPSLEWQGSDRVPVAYGILKLRIISQIVDDDLATDDILEAIEAIEGVQSADIFAFNKV